MIDNLMEKIVSLSKRRGFIFQSSEIYGGLSNTWDYGPFGVELKNNVKAAWWKANVHQSDDVFGMDAAILMHPKVWEASGHTDSFRDEVIECKDCHKRMRPEEIVKKDDIEKLKAQKKYNIDDPDPVKRWAEKMMFWDKLIILRDKNDSPRCLYCKGTNFTTLKKFNLMLKSSIGPQEDASSLIYLRPETAQGMFVNFLNILDSRHPKLPFGLAQIGKAFRNEVTPGNFTFRTREFEQMEIEYFVNPKDADKKLEEWIDSRFDWYINLGLKKENLRKRPHAKDELAHYAKACTDIEYNFPFSTSAQGRCASGAKGGSASGGGWSELEGIANRTDFDLRQHAEASGKDLQYFDDVTKEKFYPYIIEPSGGVDRSGLAFLVDAYHEEKVHPVRNRFNEEKKDISNGVKDDTRVVLKLHRDLAPIKVAVLPLLKNRPELVELAKIISADLKKSLVCVYDDTAAIGKLYRRQDEVGTPYCVTVDVKSLEDRQVTVRDRDSMLQERIAIDKLKDYLTTKLS